MAYKINGRRLDKPDPVERNKLIDKLAGQGLTPTQIGVRVRLTSTRVAEIMRTKLGWVNWPGKGWTKR